MNLRKFTGLVTILVLSCLFWCSYSIFTTAHTENFKKDQAAKAELLRESRKIYYRIHPVEHGKSIPASVYLKNRKIITFTQIAGGLTPRERAAILVNKLRFFVRNNKNPWKIFPAIEKGIAIIKYEDNILFTADVKSARVAGTDVSTLALNWANNVRRSLGAVELIRDFELFKQIADKNDEITGYNQTGVASWYGGYFHGRTAADGSIYNMYQFTAAHKSLPFGSVVKVTNLKNGSSCVVKITDRGPFIEGRIIDLSKVAAEEIGMLDSGISKVKIEVIGKV